MIGGYVRRISTTGQRLSALCQICHRPRLRPAARGIENGDATLTAPDLDLFALGKLGRVLNSSVIVLAVDVRSALEVPVIPHKVHFVVRHFSPPETRDRHCQEKTQFRRAVKGRSVRFPTLETKNLHGPHH